MTGSFVQLPGLRVFVEERGSGAPVLFISGTGGDLRMRPNVLDGPLTQDFRVIGYDQRGLGQSDKPAGPYTMQQYGADAAALLDALDLDCVHVVGVSFGGMVAQHLALDYPDRVNKLVLCCTSPGGRMPSYPFHEMSNDLTAVDRLLLLMDISDTRRDANWQRENPRIVEKLVAYTRDHAIADHETPAFKQGYQLQVNARAGHNTEARLREIRHETLICAGRFDGIAPVANQASMADLIPDSQLNWYEGGHLFLVQDKQAWPDIVAFLGR